MNNIQTQTNPTSAPELKPFNNPVTRGVLTVILASIIIGLAIIILFPLYLSFIGVVLASLGILAWWAGDTRLPADPRTAGILTFWDSFITVGGEPVVIGGRTILANYFPFFLGVVSFEITNRDKDFPISVLSSDNVPLEGVISITLRPDVNDAIDYIQAGKMENILTQLDDIVYEKSKAVARTLTADQIAKQSELISGPLCNHVSNKLEEGSFGVTIEKVQSRFDLPKDVIEAMKQKVREVHEREGEYEEYRTMMGAAVELQKKYAQDPSMAGRVPTLEQCVQEIKTLRLIRDERVARIETTGGTKNILLTDANLNMGSKKGGK